MTIEWNNRDYRFDSNGRNVCDFFGEHDERMKEFRRSHTNVALVNGVRLDEAALLERMEPLAVIRNMMETGGSRLINGTMDWSALIPMMKVARYKLSQN